MVVVPSRLPRALVPLLDGRICVGVPVLMTTLAERAERAAGAEDTRLQDSKALFLSCLIDDRVQQVIKPLVAEFAEKGWPPEFFDVFFSRLSAAALRARAAQAPTP